MRIRSTILSATAAAALLLTGAGAAHAAPAKPDLVVTFVGWGGQQTNIYGQPLAFYATIKNQGKAATPAGVIHGVGFQIDGKLVTWSDYYTSSLAPGESVIVDANSGPTGSAIWTATTGSHEILAFVDDAHRIAESNEGNNRTKATLKVSPPSVLSSTYNGTVITSKLAPLAQPTGLASTIRGDGYASCVTFDNEGAVTARPGTETYIGEYSTGSVIYHQDGPQGTSGMGDAPARATTAQSNAIDLGEIVRWNRRDPSERMTCLPGEFAYFTRLHATSITTWRYAVNPDGWSAGALLGRYTGPINIDLPM